MAKITKPQLAALADLKSRGGCVMASDWINGSGRYITAKTIPPFCKRIERYMGGPNLPARINRIFREHPRCHSVVAIIDMRSANKALAEHKDLFTQEV